MGKPNYTKYKLMDEDLQRDRLIKKIKDQDDEIKLLKLEIEMLKKYCCINTK